MSNNNTTISGTRDKAIKESLDSTKRDIEDLRSNVLSKVALVTEPLSEEEAIEAEMDQRYNQKSISVKRKFKPALIEDISNNNKIRNLVKIGAYASIVGLAGIYATEVFAAPDIELATKAGVRPLRNTLVWVQPYLLGFAGIAGAFFTEGDNKTKAIKTGVGVASLWAVSQALLSWMPNVA